MNHNNLNRKAYEFQPSIPSVRQIKLNLPDYILKARLVRSVVDRLVTYAKKGDLSARREAARIVRDPKVLQGLFNVIGPRYKNRNGGYTRVLKLGPNRPGDAAEMALVSLVEDEIKAKEAPKAEAAAAETKPVDMVKGAAKEAEAEK